MGITPFTSGPNELVNKLNDMIRLLNLLDSMTGDGLVRVNQSSAGRSLSLNIDGILQRLPKESGGGTGGSDIHLAYCAEDAPADSNIDCYLDTDETGEEINVQCNMSGGVLLNAASRRLETGDRLVVTSIDNVWYALEGFQATEDCVCSEA